jgi:hypothetical protein
MRKTSSAQLAEEERQRRRAAEEETRRHAEEAAALEAELRAVNAALISEEGAAWPRAGRADSGQHAPTKAGASGRSAVAEGPGLAKQPAEPASSPRVVFISATYLSKEWRKVPREVL